MLLFTYSKLGTTDIQLLPLTGPYKHFFRDCSLTIILYTVNVKFIVKSLKKYVLIILYMYLINIILLIS